jgi:hypothetical protein
MKGAHFSRESGAKLEMEAAVDLLRLFYLWALLGCCAADRFRKQGTCPLQNASDHDRGRLVTNSLHERNTESRHRASAVVQDGKRNVDYALYFVTLLFLKSLTLDPGQTRAEIAGRTGMVVLRPKLHHSRREFRSLMRQNYVRRRRTHEIGNCAGFYVEAVTERRIHLSHDHHVIAVKYAQMARLVKLMRNLLQDGSASVIMRLVGGYSWASLNSRKVKR